MATIRNLDVEIGNKPERPHYDQIDYILTPLRWRNAIKNAETTITGMITTDHFPLKVMTEFRLKKSTQKQKDMQTWEKCNKKEREQFNKDFIQHF